MKVTLTHIIILLISLLSNAQSCPVLMSPINGDTNVPVDASLSWGQVSGISGYLISLGSTPGGKDILNSRSAALVNTVTPIVGLPSNTRIYVTISLFKEDGTLITCPSESFMTENITVPPPCTTLSNPLNNASNINPVDDIQWNYAYGATGYRVSIGTTQGGYEIIDDHDVGNTLSYDPIEILPINTEFFVKIVPYNAIGDNGPCREERFITGDTSVNCNEYFSEITVPDTIGICKNRPTIYTSLDFAEGFRWYKLNADESETLISKNKEVSLSSTGQYRYEMYRNISLYDEINVCSISKEFFVINSEPPTVTNVILSQESEGIQMSIIVSGNGNYEFAIDNPRGPYQDSNEFNRVNPGDHVFHIRDKNGCGSTEYLVSQALKPDDFPKFFTPNGDGANDYWQYKPPLLNQLNVAHIDIFNRFGKLLIQLDSKTQGWNGNFLGKQMPEADYWYRAVSYDGQKIYGHFTLKR